MAHPPLARRLVVALAVTALLGAAACGDDGDGETAPSSSAPASTTTTDPATTTDAPTTTTTTTTTPTTTTTAPPPEPVSVLAVGDSVGYTIASQAPPDVPLVSGLEDNTLVGCGLLTSGARPPEAVALGVPPTYDGCAVPIEDADRSGLATGPDVVLLVSGAWEFADHERDGRTVGPGDEAWTRTVREALLARVQRLGAEGVPVGLWIDPCAADEDRRRRQAWYRDEVLVPVAEQTAAAGTFLVDPSHLVCGEDGGPRQIEGVGDPRAEDGQHWSAEGAAWLWRAWLGEALARGAAA